MVSRFEAWLDDQMRRQSVRSAMRLAREAGLDPARVADWAVGRKLPDAAECQVLAAYFGVPADEPLSIADSERRARESVRVAQEAQRAFLRA
jgi:hypothetical protein